MPIRPIVPVFALTFSLFACTTTPNTNLTGTSPQAVVTPTPSPSSTPGGDEPTPAVVSPTPTVSGAPVLSPDVPLPVGLASIRIAVTERFLNGRGETTRLLVTGLDAQGNPLTGALPLSFSQNRPDDFSISPDGVVTALKDFGFSEVLIRVVGTDIVARMTLSVSLPSTYSGGSGNSSGGGAAPVDTRPRITGFSANSVWAGTQVTIQGQRFGTNINDLTVLFAGVPAQIVTANDTAITVIVPRTSGTPQVTVTRAGENASASGPNVHKIIYVNDDATGNNNGITWTDAYPDLQAGLGDAVNGDKIWIAAGTYKPAASSGERASAFQMVAGVDVLGGFAGSEADPSERALNGNEVILSGDLNGDDGVIVTPLLATEVNRQDNSYNVVVAASNIHLDRLTIANGNASGEAQQGRGGGLWASGFTNISLTNLVFRANSAAYHGGGVYSLNNLIDFENCRFELNRSHRLGGGLALYGGNNVTRQLQVNNAVFENNQSGSSADYGNSGGGLYLSANTRVENSRFEGNISYYAGGALVYATSSAFYNSQFINNQAINGGGLLVEASQATLENILFDKNQALEPNGNMNDMNRGTGGGLLILSNPIENLASQVTANRVIFNQNTATSYGGALSLSYDNGTLSNALNLTNGVFVGNQVTASADVSNGYRGQGGAMALSTGGTQPIRVRYSTFSNNTTPNSTDVNIYDSTGGSPNPVDLGGSIFHATDLPGDISLFDSTQTGVDIDSSNFVDVTMPFGVTGMAFWDLAQAGLRLSNGSGMRLLAGLTPVPGTDVLGNARGLSTDWGAYQGDNTLPPS
jgi:hypothetical protein